MPKNSVASARRATHQLTVLAVRRTATTAAAFALALLTLVPARPAFAAEQACSWDNTAARDVLSLLLQAPNVVIARSGEVTTAPDGVASTTLAVTRRVTTPSPVVSLSASWSTRPYVPGLCDFLSPQFVPHESYLLFLTPTGEIHFLGVFRLGPAGLEAAGAGGAPDLLGLPLDAALGRIRATLEFLHAGAVVGPLRGPQEYTRELLVGGAPPAEGNEQIVLAGSQDFAVFIGVVESSSLHNEPGVAPATYQQLRIEEWVVEPPRVPRANRVVLEQFGGSFDRQTVRREDDPLMLAEERYLVFIQPPYAPRPPGRMRIAPFQRFAIWDESIHATQGWHVLPGVRELDGLTLVEAVSFVRGRLRGRPPWQR